MDLYVFRCVGKIRRRHCEDHSLLNHQRHKNPVELNSRKFRIPDLQECKRQALIRQTDALCAAQNARYEAVMQRLKPTSGTSPTPTPPPPAAPRRLPNLSDLQQRFRHDQDVISFKNEMVHYNWTTRTLRSQERSLDIQDEEEEEEEGYLSRDWSYSRLDSHTPEELRAIPLITTPVAMSPPPSPFKRPLVAPSPKRRVIRLPVMRGNLNWPNKEVEGGYRLQTVRGQVEMTQKGLEHLLAHVPRPRGAHRQKKTVTSAARLRPTPPPKPVPATNKGTPEAPVLPTPPAKPATSKMAKTSQRWSVHPLRTIGGGKKPASSCKPQTGGNIDLEELMPVPNPKESLRLFLDPVGSDDWEMKIKKLQSVQALVKHHPNTLKDKLQEVCYAVIEEVKNLRSSVASAAVDTIVSMYVHLQKDMDTMVDKTCCALLLKIAQSSVNVFLQQQVNKALESLVQNCSPAPVLNVLLRTGLSHRCAAVRASAAQKIHLLADSLGAPEIMSSGKSFKQNMVVAVNKICVDAAAEVRPQGLTMLEDLAFQPNFMELWGKLVPQKDRPFLEKILKKMKRGQNNIF